MTAQAGGAALRKQARDARRRLSVKERTRANSIILENIRRLPAFRAAKQIALFFAFDGEPDLSSLLGTNRSKDFFAPIITPTSMHFGAIGPQTRLESNFYGIPEPRPIELIDPRSLDLVLTPLVAFDDDGNRIGVGAGYYDRCFAFLRQRRTWFRPKLVGVAYSLQQIEPIEPNPWDVPLWAAVTENGISRFKRR